MQLPVYDWVEQGKQVMGNQQRAEEGNDYRQEGIQKKLQVDFFPAGSHLFLCMNHPYLLKETWEVEVDIIETGYQQNQDGGD